ncbi:hypothetical protein Tco_0578712 [Tanacetum coccineum]
MKSYPSFLSAAIYWGSSLEYAPTSNPEIEPFKDTSQETGYDTEDFSNEDPSEEGPSKDEKDATLSAQVAPTPPTQPTPTPPTSIIQLGRTASYCSYRLLPNEVRLMFTPSNTVHAPYTLLPSIKAAITESILAPPRKRTRSPSPPPSPSPSPPRDTILEATAEAATLPPRRMFQMTPLHLVATAEAMAEATTPRKRSDVRHFVWVQFMLHTWGVKEGLPHRLENALVLARGRISELESCLDESDAREAALERRMRAMEEHFGLAGYTQHVADAMTTYEANRNSGNGINNKTSGSAGGVEHWNG